MAPSHARGSRQRPSDRQRSYALSATRFGTANTILVRDETMATTSSTFGEPISPKVCVIYDPANGGVIHTHEVLTFPGGRQVTDADTEAEGLAVLARRTGKDVAGFGVLHVPAREYQRGVRYGVELPSRRLIAEGPTAVPQGSSEVNDVNGLVFEDEFENINKSIVRSGRR